MKPALFFLFLHACMHSTAQTRSKPSPAFAVFVMPCQILPVGNSGGFTAGAEARVYHHLAISAEAGRFYDPGYMAKLNIKGYFRTRDSDLMYVAVELAYKRQTYTVADNLRYFDTQGTPQAGTPVNYTVDKAVDILNLKCGLITLCRRAFYYGLYGGVGIRYRSVNNDLQPGQTSDLYHWNEGFIDNFTNAEYKGYALSLSLGVKIGFRYK